MSSKHVLLPEPVEPEAGSLLKKGCDNVDLTAATQNGGIVTSNLGVSTSSVVEYVLSLMLALLQQLPGRILFPFS